MSNKGTEAPQLWRNIFGIFMIIVYLGMGVLFFCNFFGFQGSWAWFRWVGGAMFVAYGIWRGWRQFRGVDYPGEQI